MIRWLKNKIHRQQIFRPRRTRSIFRKRKSFLSKRASFLFNPRVELQKKLAKAKKIEKYIQKIKAQRKRSILRKFILNKIRYETTAPGVSQARYDDVAQLILNTTRNIRIGQTADYFHNPATYTAPIENNGKVWYNCVRNGSELSAGEVLDVVLWDSGFLDEFFMGQFGDMSVPDNILEYLVAERTDGFVQDKNLPEVESLFEDAARIMGLIEEKFTKPIDKSVLYSLMGALFVECGWSWMGVYNQLEAGTSDEDAGKEGSGVAGTTGFKNCGECWFGLTGWEQKKQIIKHFGWESEYMDGDAPKSTYNPTDKKMLCFREEEDQIKMLQYYLEKMTKQYGDIIFDPDEELDRKFFASFLFKAGNWKKTVDIEAVMDSVERYKKTHTKQSKNPNFKPSNGFCLQVYIGILLALYCEKGECEKIEEVDKLLGVTGDPGEK